MSFTGKSFCVGDRNRFAIFFRISDPAHYDKERLFLKGYFAFYCNNDYVGYPLEECISLPLCYGFTVSSLNLPQDRVDDHLFGLPKDELFLRVGDAPYNYIGIPPEYLENKRLPKESEETLDRYALRFPIEYMGPMALYGFRILLIKNSQGKERLLWRNVALSDYHVREIYLNPMEFENTIEAFAFKFREECKNNRTISKNIDIDRWCDDAVTYCTQEIVQAVEAIENRWK